MPELLAVLIALFVVYALYEIFKTVAESGLESSQPALATAAPAPVSAKVPLYVPPTPPARPEAAPPAAPAPATVAASSKIVNLRNPLTGEVSPVPNNYRFAKKWVKEALVAEGLLKKVYKNSELTEAVSPKVKEAIEQLKKLPQYQA